MHDPVVYPQPDEFNPERYLKNGNLDAEDKDPTRVMFGFGRRYVVGKQAKGELISCLTNPTGYARDGISRTRRFSYTLPPCCIRFRSRLQLTTVAGQFISHLDPPTVWSRRYTIFIQRGHRLNKIIYHRFIEDCRCTLKPRSRNAEVLIRQHGE